MLPAFLTSMLATAGQGIAEGAAGGFLQDIFGSNRVSNKDYQHYQNLLDSSNPRDIARQGAFLKGLAPAQGEAYNTYQDATYGADTDRQIDRIQNMAGKLGMSPWEIVGSGGSQPLPSGGPPQNQGPQGAAYLQAVTPVKIAQMQAKTALAQTKMQTDTQLKTTAMQTNNGEQAKAQTLATHAQRFLANAQEVGAYTQARVAESGALVSQIAAIAQLLPTDSTDFGFMTRTSKAGWETIARAIAASKSPVNADQEQPPNLTPTVAAAIRSIDSDEWTAMLTDIRQAVGKTVSYGTDVWTKYLGSLTK